MSNTENDSARHGGSDHQWLFDCNVCSFTSAEDSEVEALNAADKHCDYGPGHFDFEIRNPDGEAVYP